MFIRSVVKVVRNRHSDRNLYLSACLTVASMLRGRSELLISLPQSQHSCICIDIGSPGD